MRNVLPVLLLFLLAAPARAEDIAADYTVTFLGLSIGNGTLISRVDGRSYTATLNGRTTGIAALFSSGTGTATASGRIAGHAVVPAEFSVEIRSGGKVETTRMSLAGGTVRSVRRDPDKPPHPRATPVLPEHLTGVLDPLSAGVFIASGNGPVTGAGACDRRSRIYSGTTRFDLIYSFVETRPVEIAGYKGEAAICRVRFEPVSGFRADRSDLQSARRRSAELTLVPVSGTRFLVPARVHLVTGYGTGVAEATRLALGPPARRAAGN